MNIAELKKDMKANNLAGLYIFTGEEIYIRNLYIEQIVDLGFIWKELPTVAELFKSVGTTKLIQKPTLYVIRDDMDFIKQDSTVWDKLVAWVNNSVNNVEDNSSQSEDDNSSDNRVIFESGSVVIQVGNDCKFTEAELLAIVDKLMSIMARKLQLRQLQTRK